MSGTQHAQTSALELSAPPHQQAVSDANAVHISANGSDRLMVGQPIPEFMTPAELRERVGLDRTTFRELQLAGDLDDLVVQVGHRTFYSGRRLNRWLDGDIRPAAEERAPGEGKRRFLAAARRATARKTAPTRKTHARHDTRIPR